MVGWSWSAVLRTFTASQFFRLIIQRARIHPTTLSAIASDGWRRDLKFWEREKRAAVCGESVFACMCMRGTIQKLWGVRPQSEKLYPRFQRLRFLSPARCTQTCFGREYTSRPSRYAKLTRKNLLSRIPRNRARRRERPGGRQDRLRRERASSSRIRPARAINQDSHDNEIQCSGPGCVRRVLSKAPIYLSYKTV